MAVSGTPNTGTLHPSTPSWMPPSATPQHSLFDLPGYIAARLAAAGIRGIEDLGHCTYADAARFFSYRRSTHRKERDYGRHINAIALVG